MTAVMNSCVNCTFMNIPEKTVKMIKFHVFFCSCFYRCSLLHLQKNLERTKRKKVLGVLEKLMENENKVCISLRRSVVCLIVTEGR